MFIITCFSLTTRIRKLNVQKLDKYFALESLLSMAGRRFSQTKLLRRKQIPDAY